MTSSKALLTDRIDGIVRAADGRRKIELTKDDFPLTCKEGDELTIVNNGKDWQMYLYRRDRVN